MSVAIDKPFTNRLRGFTLIEVLIAMLIFGFVGLGAYQILDQVVKAQEINQRHSEQLRRTQRVSWQLGKDFRQMVYRKIQDGENAVSQPIAYDSEDAVIEFTRGGWTNPLQWPRSELQRVAYRVDYHPDADDPDSPYYNDDALFLIRSFWNVLDRIENSEPIDQVMMRGVVDFRTRFWDLDEQDWQEKVTRSLPDFELVNYNLPYAVEVSLVLDTDEVLTYVFQIM